MNARPDTPNDGNKPTEPVDALHAAGEHAASATSETNADILRRAADHLGRRLASEGIADVRDTTAEHIMAYVDDVSYRVERGSPQRVDDPSDNTRAARFGNARRLFAALRALGLVPPAFDPLVDTPAPPREGAHVRPLTDSEMDTVRHAVTSTETLSHGTYKTVIYQPAIAVAVAQAGATATELASITFADLDLDRRTVYIWGNPLRRIARTAPLTAWAVDVVLGPYLETISRRHPDDYAGRAVVSPGGKDVLSRQAASTAALGKALKAADLLRDPTVKPRSVAWWRSAALYADTGSLVDVAVDAGVLTLDAAATLAGVGRWHPAHWAQHRDTACPEPGDPNP